VNPKENHVIYVPTLRSVLMCLNERSLTKKHNINPENKRKTTGIEET
jgi:hypothetical protein